MNSTGKLVKQFRTSKGMTQQELELAIGASSGHISRIESGKVDPSKETLLKIVSILELDEYGKNILFGFGDDPVNKKQIREVIAKTREYIDNSKYPAHLMDDFFFIHNWNKKMLNLLGVTPAIARPFRGVNALTLLSSKYIPVRDSVSKEKWEEVMINEFMYFMKSTNYFERTEESFLVKMILKMRQKDKEFDILWQKARKLFSSNVRNAENYIYFNVKGKEKRFYMSVISIPKYPRFKIIEYI